MNELVLRDIHLPDVALWWPPAPGWWILLIAAIGLLFVVPRLWQWMRHQSMKKRSQIAFKQIEKDFNQHQDQQRLVAELSILLRRVMMSYQGRQQTAGLTGHAWLQQLTDLVETPCFSDDQQMLLIHGQYARDIDIDCESLIISCEHWIKALPRRSQHVSA